MDRRSLFKGLATCAVLPVLPAMGFAMAREAIVGEVGPEVLIRLRAVSGPTGYSRSVFEVKASAAQWHGANMYIDVPNDPSLPIRHVI